jgi:hypothetical protein
MWQGTRGLSTGCAGRNATPCATNFARISGRLVRRGRAASRPLLGQGRLRRALARRCGYAEERRGRAPVRDNAGPRTNASARSGMKRETRFWGARSAAAPRGQRALAQERRRAIGDASM